MRSTRKRTDFYIPVYSYLTTGNNLELRDHHHMYDIHGYYWIEEGELFFGIDLFYLRTPEETTIDLTSECRDYALSLVQTKYKKDEAWADSLWSKEPLGCGHDLF